MLERTLARLKDATDDLAPPPGFANRVAERVARRRDRPTALALAGIGRRAVIVAAFAAAAATAGAWFVDRDVDQRAAALVDVAGFGL